MVTSKRAPAKRKPLAPALDLSVSPGAARIAIAVPMRNGKAIVHTLLVPAEIFEEHAIVHVVADRIFCLMATAIAREAKRTRTRPLVRDGALPAVLNSRVGRAQSTTGRRVPALRLAKPPSAIQ